MQRCFIMRLLPHIPALYLVTQCFCAVGVPFLSCHNMEISSSSWCSWQCVDYWRQTRGVLEEQEWKTEREQECGRVHLLFKLSYTHATKFQGASLDITGKTLSGFRHASVILNLMSCMFILTMFFELNIPFPSIKWILKQIIVPQGLQSYH